MRDVPHFLREDIFFFRIIGFPYPNFALRHPYPDPFLLWPTAWSFSIFAAIPAGHLFFA